MTLQTLKFNCSLESLIVTDTDHRGFAGAVSPKFGDGHSLKCYALGLLSGVGPNIRRL